MQQNCNRQLLSAYADGELDPAAMASVEDHIRNCADCAFELAELRDLSGKVHGLGLALDDISSEETQRIHDAMDLSQEEDRSILRLGSVISVIAASILVICGTWLAVLPGEQHQTTSVTQQQQLLSLSNAEPWERMAMTLQADPSSLEDRPVYAADWMLQGLNINNNGGNGP